jgi:hypothetical protein
MSTTFKIGRDLLAAARADLARPHAFAAERMGFVSCRASGSRSTLVILAEDYHPIADDHYVRDWTVGARMNGDAIRAALQIALSGRRSIFHVHMHEHRGTPGFSPVDVREHRRFVPDFFNVVPSMPHGALVLSLDGGTGVVCVDTRATFLSLDEFVVVGSPLTFTWGSR